MDTKSELPVGGPKPPSGGSVNIPATVGRIVWFFTTTDLGWGEHIEGSPEKPRAAIVANADHPDVLNLCVYDFNGVPRPMTSVRLVQDGDKPADTEVYWCEWMPYQKGQAAKAEAAVQREHLVGAGGQGQQLGRPASIYDERAKVEESRERPIIGAARTKPLSPEALAKDET